MNDRIRTLQAQWNELAARGDEIRAEYASKAMPAEVLKNITDLYTDMDAIEADIAQEKQAVAREKRMGEVVNLVHPTTGAPLTADAEKHAEKRALWLKALSGDLVAQKAYQADSDVEGGYSIAPEQFLRELIQRVDDAVEIRALARTFDVPRAESLGAPALDTDLGAAEWTSELDTGTEDTALRLGKRSLHPHPLVKMIKMSETLMRKATLINVEDLLMERMAYAFASTEERAFLTGNGAEQPLGLFTASVLGISTARDVNTGSATDVTADGLIRAVYTLKSAYRKNARFIFHREVLRNIRLLKDAAGQYLWVSGLQQNTAPQILGFPYVESEFAPNTFTNGNYAFMFGDLNHYWIVDALDFRVKVLDQLYARSNQIGYLARAELDAMPVIEEAFIRGKFAA